MSKPSSRDSLAESSNAYKEIEAEVRANYPSAVDARERAELVAVSVEAVTIALAGLLKLCSMDTPSDRASAPQVIDERAVQLRDFCQKLFGAACDEFKLGDRWPWLLHLRAKLDAPPALGTELADASLVLLSAAQMFLNLRLQVEVGKVTGLPCEKLEDHIDEEARSRISDAASDTDLAHMKQFADEDSECDSNQTDSHR